MGIIPTRVGTSLSAPSQPVRVKDHPHACGDKLRLKRRVRKVIGSSPRVWGQVVLYMRILIVSRIIPTRVGTSFTKLSQNCHTEDHPHACGDKPVL